MEVEYRKKIQELFDSIEKAFDHVDPDLAECEQTLGSLILTFTDTSRCILSVQPSVQQLWLAVASKGTAYHFNFESKSCRWIDDKGRGIELIGFLEQHFKEVTGVGIKI